VRFSLVFVPFLLVACGDDASSESSDSTADTSAMDTGCEYECFPGARCMGGVVAISTGSQPTCGMCGGATYTCKKGCRSDDAGFTSGVFAPELLCEESRPKRPGDRCTEQLDCVPIEEDAGIGAPLYCAEAGTCAVSEDAASEGG
jgi:hypothetical protein